jgi:uncharacterized protein YndB with AHSA1/START domain
METGKTIITVETTVDATINRVWKFWTSPEHIIHWNNASDDWHTPRAENDFRVGGSFLSRMEAKNGSFGFDFAGAYNEIITHELIIYTLFDGRKVHINFTSTINSTTITESFEAENENPIEIQKGGWQSILDNFKRYVESNI